MGRARIGTFLESKYDLVRVLGAGGMGEVYEAQHRELRRRVAIKFLLPHFAAQFETVARFTKEARAAASLDHENVAAVYDTGAAPDGARYLVMEYLEGEDCGKFLARNGRLASEQAVQLIIQVCRGLSAVHSLGIVHRDLKPANLFITKRADESVLIKILDFGIAKLRGADGGDVASTTGPLFGTPHYMSPEQARGSRELDHRSDIYTAGVILYELLSGRKPHDGSSALQIAHRIATQPPQPLSEMGLELPRGLEEVVAKAMARDADARFASAIELGTALAPFALVAPWSGLHHAGIQWVHPSTAQSVLTDGHVLGRDPDCNTVLPGEEVSRRHADVEMQGFVPLLRDRGSRNGVFINGVRERQRPIGPGDVVRIGEWVGLTVELDPVQPSPPEFVEIAKGWYGGRALTSVADVVRRVAPTDLAVVVEGETGVGKEGVARALHSFSGRGGKFVPVDCGALPENLAESLFFGHQKGVFTGASEQRDGHFMAAHRGTLFLDEILNLSPTLQAKLLRAIENREIVRVGESRALPVDVRIVCAAQEPLREAVAAHRLRADLFARLDGVTVLVPPLRARRLDIVPLFMKLVTECGHAPPRSLDARFAEALLLYDWPLNVRELMHLAKRLVTLHEGNGPFRKSMLPSALVEAALAPRPVASAPIQRAATGLDVDFQALVSALRAQRGNISKAAKTLGISRSRANRILDAHPDFDRATVSSDDEP